MPCGQSRLKIMQRYLRADAHVSGVSFKAAGEHSSECGLSYYARDRAKPLPETQTEWDRRSRAWSTQIWWPIEKGFPVCRTTQKMRHGNNRNQSKRQEMVGICHIWLFRCRSSGTCNGYKHESCIVWANACQLRPLLSSAQRSGRPLRLRNAVYQWNIS